MAPKKPTCATEGCDGEAFAMSPICTRCFVAQPVEERKPPVPSGCDLRTFPDMPLDVIKLYASDMRTEVTPEEGWYALQLWMKSWHTVPASSLPNDERKLADAAGLGRDLRTWKKIRSGAVRGFVECSDGRLYHLVLAEKACNAWDIKKGRQRGAVLTNTKAKNGQGLGNKENDQRSAGRSKDAERHDQRTLSGDGAPRSASASAVATEKSREENKLISSSSSTARETANLSPAERARLGIELGELLVDACGYSRHDVMEFSKVQSWLNSDLTADEIRAAIPVVAEKIRGMRDKPRALLAYADPILKTEIANIRNGVPTATAMPNASTGAGPAYENRYRAFRKDPKSWRPNWGDPIVDTPAHVRAKVDAEYGGPPANAAA